MGLRLRGPRADRRPGDEVGRVLRDEADDKRAACTLAYAFTVEQQSTRIYASVLHLLSLVDAGAFAMEDTLDFSARILPHMHPPEVGELREECRSLVIACFSIWRILSLERLYLLPSSFSVMGFFPFSP